MSTVRECGNCDRPISDGAAICATCSAALAKALRGVPELVEQLFASYAKQDRFGGAGGDRARPAEAPLPVRFGIKRVIDRLGNELTTWAWDLVERNGLDVPDPPRRRPHNTPKPDVPARDAGNLRRGELGRGRGSPVFPTSTQRVDLACYAAEWLADHVELVRRHPAALEAHRSLTGAIARAAMAMDRPEAQPFIGDCDGCGGELFADQHASGSTCERCGIYYGDVDQRWDRALRKLRGYPATAALIAGSIGELYGVMINQDTIRKWHQRKELTPVDWVALTEGGERKVPRFRIGAVLDRAKVARPRRAG